MTRRMWGSCHLRWPSVLSTPPPLRSQRESATPSQQFCSSRPIEGYFGTGAFANEWRMTGEARLFFDVFATAHVAHGRFLIAHRMGVMERVVDALQGGMGWTKSFTKLLSVRVWSILTDYFCSWKMNWSYICQNK